MNEYDTHSIQSELAGIGYSFVDDFREADLVLVNTCAVRGKPVEKAQTLLGELRKEKQRRGNLTVGLIGCLAQLPEGRRIGQKFGVDIMLGPGAITQIVPAIQHGKYQSFEFKSELKFYTPPPPAGALSAHVTIMRGCNHRCTYCIVPATRGPEVSRPAEDILNEVRALKDAGVVEVTLLGQNVNSYGMVAGTGSRRALLPGYPSFSELLRMVGRLGIPRVRFVTSHPVNFDDEIIEAIADTPAVCRYIHLPVQSGSDRVLKRMAREYNRDYYMDRVARIRDLLPDATVSTDIIAGFPGETAEDFEILCDFAKEAQFDWLGVFGYSDEEGANAFALEEKVGSREIERRRKKLMAIQKQISRKKKRALIGQQFDLVLEGPSEETELLWQARTAMHAPEIDGTVYVNDFGDHEDIREGQFYRCEITEAHDYDLVARIL
jgi:tRNA-2-methylthio-N6-dimethylallyladenosine synthase